MSTTTEDVALSHDRFLALMRICLPALSACMPTPSQNCAQEAANVSDVCTTATSSAVSGAPTPMSQHVAVKDDVVAPTTTIESIIPSIPSKGSTLPSPRSRRLRFFHPSRQYVRDDAHGRDRRTPTDTPEDHLARSSHLQVCKETLFFFAVHHTQRRLLAQRQSPMATGSSVVKEATPAAAAATATKRLCEGVYPFSGVKAIESQSSGERSKTGAGKCTTPLADAAPMRSWTGSWLYRAWLPQPAFSPTTTNQKKKASIPLFSGAKTADTRVCRRLVASEDVVREVEQYWKLHREAEARARLHALRHKDAGAFAEHVSLLKVSTLLRIMEKTSDFMQRIGLKLRSRAESSTGTGLAGGTDGKADGCRGDKMAIMPAAADARLAQNSEYQRFKAYVASTKDDYRLVHQVDVFVSEPPAGLHATLLPHQMDGLRFLASLHANHINGILADEMGVGKTMQTLAFLLYLKEQKASAPRPHLVLAPLSVVREWREACEQFVPDSLRVGLFQDLQDPISEAPAFDLVLLPVHAVRHCRATLTCIQWGYIVVDEAHKAVANLNTLTAQSILALPYERRLVLTGTPLNSDLQELWSLLFFLNPDVFTESDRFDEVFRRPFVAYDAKEMDLSSEERALLVLRLHQILRPFMLRRTKQDVDRTLRITFHELRCPLTALQARLLQLLRQDKRTPCVLQSEEASTTTSTSDDDEENDSESKAQNKAEAPCGDDTVHDRCYGLSSANVSESTAQLLCNHAFLLPFPSQVLLRHGRNELEPNTADHGAADTVLSCSGKFLFLHVLLSRLHAVGHKAVLFTHWLDCVDLLVEYFTGRGWAAAVEVLCGSTSEADRKARVRRFRDDPSCLFFVVSIKAGGCGINLQAAHLVLLVDRDYTTTNEDQALARVFRIGQRHTVRAVYLTTADPAEAKITTRAAVKNKPRQAIIEEGQYQVGTAPTTTDGHGTDTANERVVPKRADETCVLPDGPAVCDAYGQQRGTRVDEDSTSTPFTALEGDEGREREEEEGRKLYKADDAPDDGASAGLHGGRHITLIDTLALCSRLSSRLAQGLREVVDNHRHNERSSRYGGGGGAAAAAAADVTDEEWSDLAVLVSSLDELVLTDADRAEGVLPKQLHACAPPCSREAFFQQWQRESEVYENSSVLTEGTLPFKGERGESVNANSSSAPTDVEPAVPEGERSDQPAHAWAAFWGLLRTAEEGPSLLMRAVQTAVDNDVARREGRDTFQLARRARKARRTAERLRLLRVDPPPEFWMECWENGMEDDDAIRRAYVAQREARRHHTVVKRGRTNPKETTDDAHLPNVTALGSEATAAEAHTVASGNKGRKRGRTTHTTLSPSPGTEVMVVLDGNAKLRETHSSECGEEEEEARQEWMPQPAPAAVITEHTHLDGSEVRRKRGRPRKNSAVAMAPARPPPPPCRGAAVEVEEPTEAAVCTTPHSASDPESRSKGDKLCRGEAPQVAQESEAAAAGDVLNDHRLPLR